jgi:hypothetical protein
VDVCDDGVLIGVDLLMTLCWCVDDYVDVCDDGILI